MLHEPISAGTEVAFDLPILAMPSSRLKSIAVIGNSAFSLTNFRGPLIAEFVRNGAKVFALAPDHDTSSETRIRSLGAIPVGYSLDRTGMKPVRDLSDAFKLFRLLRRLRPDATLSYFIKPVIYGTLAARLAGVRRRYALVPGLGYAFISRGIVQRLVGGIARFLYRLAFAAAHRVIFYNDDDARHFAGAIHPDKIVRLNGTGVDLARFTPAPLPAGTPTFLFIGRLLREKGVSEFVEAARTVRHNHPDCRFVMVGGLDCNPGSIDQAQLDAWRSEGAVDIVGHVDDVRPWIASSSVFVLPSYREGVPRSTQEAMAMGRPVLTTDTPGCRETVAGNGFLVPPRDPDALAAAMLRFINNPGLIASMGRASRRLAEERFDVRRINAEILRLVSRTGA